MFVLPIKHNKNINGFFSFHIFILQTLLRLILQYHKTRIRICSVAESSRMSFTNFPIINSPQRENFLKTYTSVSAWCFKDFKPNPLSDSIFANIAMETLPPTKRTPTYHQVRWHCKLWRREITSYHKSSNSFPNRRNRDSPLLETEEHENGACSASNRDTLHFAPWGSSFRM